MGGKKASGSFQWCKGGNLVGCPLFRIPHHDPLALSNSLLTPVFIYLSTYLLVCLHLYLANFCLCSSACLSVVGLLYLFVCVLVNLIICLYLVIVLLFVCLSVFLYVVLSICVAIDLSICLSFFRVALNK